MKYSAGSTSASMTAGRSSYNTGFTLESIGSLQEQMGISPLTGQTYGSTNASYFLRPQHTVNIDANHFRTWGSQQWGYALASSTVANAAFANLVPGIDFGGYDTPFHWNNLTPRAGVTFALDEERKTIVRASFSRNAGQLSGINGNIGYANPSSSAGWGGVSVD